MHHFIFPTQDTWITNKTGYSRKNFGLDEILQIGVSSVNVTETVATKTYTYSTWTNVVRYDADNFTGWVTGSFECGTVQASGSVGGTAAAFSSSWFTGSVTGDIIGWNLIEDQELSSSWSGDLTSSFSGSISSSVISGYVSGSVVVKSPGIFTYFSGSFLSASGLITGWISGSETKNQQNVVVQSRKFVDRALLKFDIDAISQSISNGAISNPMFSLKLKTSKATELPLSYKIYAYPISQSWQMGNGYYSDGGSTQGANWYYKDNDLGNQWWVPSTQSLNPNLYNYLDNEFYATESFKYGGATWYYSGSNHLDDVMTCTQSFNYEASDFNIDITKIVMAWISGSIPNEGIVLMHSDEISTTASYANLKMFSKDTNTIYSPKIDAKWDDSIWISGSISTGSVVMSYTQSGMSGSAVSGSTFTLTGGLGGCFEANAFAIFTDNPEFSGFMDGTGSCGDLTGLSISGGITGSWESATITGSCGKSFDTTLLTGSITSGKYSGSAFYSYYDDGVIWNGWITGSWSIDQLLGLSVNMVLPSTIPPYTYAYVSGALTGTAFGTYELSGSDSASFNGQFISGEMAGGYLFVQLTGSFYTASFYTTQSVSLSTSSLNQLDIDQPFAVIVKNVLPEYKAGDIVKIGVFGRPQYPLKNFTRATQPLGYIVPEYLPSSSYYAIKDNETEEILVDFDNYTKMSCVYPDGNFFMLDTTGLPQERRFRILTRIESGSSVYTFDNGNVFKITR